MAAAVNLSHSSFFSVVVVTQPSTKANWYCMAPLKEPEYKQLFNMPCPPGRDLNVKKMVKVFEKIVQNVSFASEDEAEEAYYSSPPALSSRWILALFQSHKAFIRSIEWCKLYRLTELMESSIKRGFRVTILSSALESSAMMDLFTKHLSSTGADSLTSESKQNAIEEEVKIVSKKKSVGEEGYFNMIKYPDTYSILFPLSKALVTIMTHSFEAVCESIEKTHTININTMALLIESQLYVDIFAIASCVLRLSSDRVELVNNVDLFQAIANNTCQEVMRLYTITTRKKSHFNIFKLLMCCYLRARLMYVAACFAKKKNDLLHI